MTDQELEKEHLEQAHKVMKNGEQYVIDNAKEIPWIVRNLYIDIDRLHMEIMKRDEQIKREKQYNEWCEKNRLKGYASGHMTRCVGLFTIEHGLAEDVEKVRTVIRKLANNPAIAMDVRSALDKAVWYIGMYLEYRKDYYELRDTQKGLIRLEFKKKMAKKKAGD